MHCWIHAGKKEKGPEVLCGLRIESKTIAKTELARQTPFMLYWTRVVQSPVEFRSTVVRHVCCMSTSGFLAAQSMLPTPTHSSSATRCVDRTDIILEPSWCPGIAQVLRLCCYSQELVSTNNIASCEYAYSVGAKAKARLLISVVRLRSSSSTRNRFPLGVLLSYSNKVCEETFFSASGACASQGP